MKAGFFLLILPFLAGCETRLPTLRPLPEPPPLRGRAENYAVSPVREPVSREIPNAASDEKSTQQARVIEALIAQNDALSARLRAAAEEPRKSAISGAPSLETAVEAAPADRASPIAAPLASVAGTTSPPRSDLPFLTPNADGIIDTTARLATDGLPNPFAVRGALGDRTREVTLDVQGIIAGAKRCAIVNGRVIEPGDFVESLRLTRLGAESLVLNGDDFALNLPFGATKVRLPL